MKSNKGGLFLGIDLSTQGLKATIIDSGLNVVCEKAVNFDADLPEFKTKGGVHVHKDGLTVTSPALMWVAAMDLLLDRMKGEGCSFNEIVAISGSGQQHGSVWLANGARKMLAGLDGRKSLREQLSDLFSIGDSPIWMDASTTQQCKEREKALGGAQTVADLTGSRAYERFTGNQIAKIWQKNKAGYESTERVALVSSFAASLLVGGYVPIDASDGSGMNLMDLKTKKWSKAALDCTAPGLGEKLGDIALSHSVVGRVHKFYCDRYGFGRDCQVVAFSGDNPNSLAGLRLGAAGDIAISLGTSYTMFGVLSKPAPSAHEGHIFANPVDPATYMAMVVWQNGALTLERMRDKYAGGSWAKFQEMMGKTRAGNEGNIGFYIETPEITPPILKPCVRRFDIKGGDVAGFPPETDLRAVVESQMISMRVHGCNIGLEPERILATGGVSQNKTVLKVICDVFGVPVYVAKQANSASLGAAYRAKHGWECGNAGKFVPYAVTLAGAPPFTKVMDPDLEINRMYSDMIMRYRELEKKLTGGKE